MVLFNAETDAGLCYIYFESDGLHKPSISKRKYKLFHHSKRHISLCTAYGWDRVNFLCYSFYGVVLGYVIKTVLISQA